MPYKSYLVNYASFLGVAVGLNTFLSTWGAVAVSSESSLFPNLTPLVNKLNRLETTADKLERYCKIYEFVAPIIFPQEKRESIQETINNVKNIIKTCQNTLQRVYESKWIRIQAIWLLIYSVIILFLIGLGLTGEKISLQSLFFATIIFSIFTTIFYFIPIQPSFKGLSPWVFISSAVQILSLGLGYLYENNCPIDTPMLDPLYFVACMILSTLWSASLHYTTIPIASRKVKTKIDKAEEESTRFTEEILTIVNNSLKGIVKEIGENIQKDRLHEIDSAIEKVLKNPSISK